MDRVEQERHGRMKKLFIVGAGDFAREVYGWLMDLRQHEPGWSFGGFLDDNRQVLDDYDYEPGVVSTIKDFRPQRDELLVMGIGMPRTKLEIAALLDARGAQWLTVIHPTAIIGRHVTLGRGCVLCPRVVLTCDLALGDFVMINIAGSCSHNTRIGDGCTLSSHSDVTGYAQLGTGVFLGSHAAVLPRVRIGNYATVGAGSVVIHHVKTETTVMGVPAKRITF